MGRLLTDASLIGETVVEMLQECMKPIKHNSLKMRNRFGMQNWIFVLNEKDFEEAKGIYQMREIETFDFINDVDGFVLANYESIVDLSDRLDSNFDYISAETSPLNLGTVGNYIICGDTVYQIYGFILSNGSTNTYFNINAY